MTVASPTVSPERVDAVRAFNRFYTAVIGVLRQGLLDTAYSLTEARVLFELAQREATEHRALRERIDVDAGYLSRILAGFERDGLTSKERSPTDGRRQLIRLTPAGREAFRTLDERSAREVGRMLARLTDEDQRRVVAAMGVIRRALGEAPAAPPYVLRPPRSGDLGWVVARHGVRYAEEYGWDERFEALVAGIVAGFGEHHDPRRERAWIAEVDGEPVGCVFCVRADDETAQLRLLLVEPRARGMGIGTRLVDECLRFAKQAGYRRITLWTNDVLADARRVYERAGFELVESEPHHSFGHDLVGQYWRKAL